MAFHLDETDLNILEHLQEDGRRSNVEIARALGVSESTVRKRIDRMQHAGVFRTVIIPDFASLGLEGHLIIGIHAELGKAPEIADRLADLQEVRLVALTTGAFDLVADVFLPSVSDYLAFVQDELARIPGIKGVETSTVLRQPKSRYNWTEMLRRGHSHQPSPDGRNGVVAT
ncbi:MAG TPA: Lrp/AsnC family transcriptional regulator [Thermomicrobiales bacterium]|jgi:Lrp/AsnC family transcriptional regulator for asnA, asnC and gidA